MSEPDTQSSLRTKRIRETAELIVSQGATYKTVMDRFKVSSVTAKEYLRAALDSLPPSRKAIPPPDGRSRLEPDYSHTDAYQQGFEVGLAKARAELAATPTSTIPLEHHTKRIVAEIVALRVALLGERGKADGEQRDVPVDVHRFMLDIVLRVAGVHGTANLCPTASPGALKRYTTRGGFLPQVEFEELERAYVLARWRQLELDEFDLEELDGVRRSARRERLDEAAEEQRV